MNCSADPFLTSLTGDGILDLLLLRSKLVRASFGTTRNPARAVGENDNESNIIQLSLYTAMYLRKETPSEHQTSLSKPEPLGIVEYAHNLSSYAFTTPGGREQRAIRFLHELPVPLQIQTPADVANYVMSEVYYPWSACTQEEMFGLALNTRNCITHNYLVHRGSIDTIPIRIADVFRPAVILNARSVIVSHNHPSSDPEPSPEDVHITRALVDAGRLLDVEVMDHIVVGREQFVSMKERGLAFS